MKKITAVALFVFWSVTTAIITAGLIVYGAQQFGFFKTADQKTMAGAEKQGQSANVVLTADEVAKHNKDADCWLIIGGKVYDVSDFVYAHPGEAKAIIPVCGKDATKDYQTKDKEIANDHSQQAYALLANYYIGDLNQTMQPKEFLASNTAPVGSSGQQQNAGAAGQISSENILLSLEEVAKHSTLNDCWVAIGGKVYNLTSYFTLHPGGTNAILTSCGKDGTSAYATKGGGGSSHSSYAQGLLPTFYLGDLDQLTSASTVQNVQNKVQQDIQSGVLRGGDDDEYEDD